MPPFARRAAALAALLFAAACADRPSPAEPGRTAGPPAGSAAAGRETAAAQQQARSERLARRFALALGDAEFRGKVLRALGESPFREGKVHFQRFLDDARGTGPRRLAVLSGDSEAEIQTDLDQSPPIEIYLPVPEHRRRWNGDAGVLVATAERDHDAPVAFDVHGRRLVLDPERPPATPVIALGRAEASFAAGGPSAVEEQDKPVDDITGGGTGGSGTGSGTGTGTTAAASAGLYMTYAKFNSTFEGYRDREPDLAVAVTIVYPRE